MQTRKAVVVLMLLPVSEGNLGQCLPLPLTIGSRSTTPPAARSRYFWRICGRSDKRPGAQNKLDRLAQCLPSAAPSSIQMKKSVISAGVSACMPKSLVLRIIENTGKRFTILTSPIKIQAQNVSNILCHI